MTETPFYFANGSHSLFGVLHEPEAAPVNAGFVFCHPFGEEKLWSHRVYVTFARALTNTFAGIRPEDVAAFVAAQLVGAILAHAVAKSLAVRRSV